jgi:hypothetical protein
MEWNRAEILSFLFSSVFRPIVALFFFISLCLSSEPGWYFLEVLTLRLAALDVAKPALPHPVRPRAARTSPGFLRQLPDAASIE